MKNKLTFLLATLFLLTLSPQVEAKQYCEEAVNLGGLNGSQNYCNFNLTCEKRSNTEYVVIATITKEGCTFKADAYNSLRNPWKKGENSNYYDIASYCVLSNSNKTLTVTFPWEPQFTANGSALALLTVQGKNSYGNNANWGCPMPTDITWGTCGPKDTEKPVISTVTATNIGNTSATINVAATDNTGITKVVIKNGANELVNQTITATPNLNGSYSVTGLTKNTSYTLTITVSDAAGNTSDAKTVTFKTTNTKEPTINSAAHASSTATQIVLNVTATDANKYKVVEKGGQFSDKILEVSSGTATNGQITITGLSGSTTYNLRVYAMWDGTMSTNYKDVTVTTPLGSQCDGTRSPASGSGTALKYEIMFDGTDVNITLQSANSDDPLETCIVESYINKGSSTTQFANVTATNGIAVATFNRPLGEIEYFRFQYKTRNMGSATSTANGSHETAKLVYYVVGDCQPDPDVPYMKSVTKAGATTTSITLNVSAIVNGGANTVTQYKVSVGGAATTYTATGGQITINGLTHSTSYDFEVWALYNGNQSENSKTVTASTNKESECEGTRGHFADNTWAEIDYKIEYDGEAKQIKITVTCATKTLTTLQTEWSIPGVTGSAGMENFTGNVYTKAVTDAMLGNPMLIRIQYGYSGRDGLSVTADGLAENSTGIIYYVVGECSGTDAENPVATSATAENVGNTTADIRVEASDDTGITRVVIKNGSTTVKDINIDPTRNLDQAFTVTGLTRNTTYSNFSVIVYDRENKSATANVPSFTTTDTPEPTIISASEVLVDASMAILAVTSTQANQYKVVEANGLIADQILQMTSGTAADGRITVTGLKRLTNYTFHVYAMYNNTVSSNHIDVSFTTPNGSECSGTRGHYTGEAVSPVDFEIDFIPSNRQLQVRLTCEKELTVRMINWTCNATTVGMTSTGFTGDTYTYTVSDDMIGKPMYIRFEYSYSGISGNRLTAQNLSADDPNIIYYVVGECECAPDDGDKPTMGEVSIASATDNTVTLNVEGSDPSSTVASFVINDVTYHATNRKITISGLEPCKEYTWNIYAKDPSCNVSDNYKTITVTTAAENYIRPTDHVTVTAVFNYEGNSGFQGKEVIDGNFTTRGGTQIVNLGNLEEALYNSILTIDLGTIRMINEIDIYWERACATDYELQVSIDGTIWSTIERYTSMPKWVIYTETPEKGKDNMIYRFHTMPARHLRVVPNTLYSADGYGVSIWEIEVYGECDADHNPCPIVLGVRSVSTQAQSAVIQVSAIDEQTPAQTDLTYIVTAETTIPGRTTISNTYTFEPGGTNREDIGATDDEKTTANLTLDGLIPGAYYTITVQAQDPDDNLSCNENSIEIRTGKAESCLMTMESSEAIVTDEWLAFPDGMSYEITLNNENANQFEATISFNGLPAGTTINNVYLSVQKQYTQTDCYAGWVDTVMNAGIGNYTLTLRNNDTYVRLGQDGCDEVLTQEYEMPLFPEWPNLELAFLIETNTGNYHTRLFDYNAEASISGSECEELFIIYHNGSQPANDMKTQFAGGYTEHDIRYYRLFHPGIWEDLTLPFNVSSIQVYDPDDHQYYNLTATTTESSPGNFLLRTQKPNVSGEKFIDSWQNGSDPLPLKDQPYAIRFTGDYYKDKFVLFNGNTQNISTSFTVGTPATGDDMYNVFGNNTMMPQNIGGKAYLLPEDHSDALYRLSENAVVRPFETYVLASQNTYRIMSRIGPWQGGPNTATSLEEVEMTLTQRPEVMLYTITGQPIAVFRNTTIQEVADECYNNYPAGSYIICAEGYVMKMVK